MRFHGRRVFPRPFHTLFYVQGVEEVFSGCFALFWARDHAWETAQ